ncbi:UDP-glucose:(indol-3-yl)acetate beta-D-glucosyltransferase protein [Dioscorea alata]|uniref:UDP-glucose:(Indol-3-yl)acetate beta-D-glucosyltransferase protein n=1 Tax=Dioscorea alata TaxID=55571 RepID=A0ACB7VM10_DIOAL|nr:UDP-glucose:(indol-3-yl)acetate beta-D-glucosyltransferase protein [Dioscorea alata]
MAPHVLILPFPVQGHINPMLQFAKRLSFKGPKTTLATTTFIINSINIQTDQVSCAPFSDGYDDTGLNGARDNIEAYFESLRTIGSKTLEELIVKQMSSSCPFTCMVYDTFVPWAVEVTEKYGLPCVAFSTQSCAVSSIYYHFNHGLLDLPDSGATVSLHGLVPLERFDFPSFTFRDGSYPALAGLSLNQFNAPQKSDWVLFNSFDELENEVIKCLKEQWNARTIGPTVPSKFMDKRIEGDENYTMNLLKPESDLCINWLNKKPANSTVYVSFGSFANLQEEQTQELALGLKQSNKYFLWVVRASEQDKLPRREEFIEGEDKGLIVAWSPQLEILNHVAIGCFLTHCGWNSTLEGLSLGVPMVAVPQWTDQPTNAKYAEDVWGVGVKVKIDEKKVVRRDEISRCIKEVMDGERSEEIRRNASKWKEVAKQALCEGGTSDENLNEFVEFLNASSCDIN